MTACISKRRGYRRVTRYEPTFGQWLKENNRTDARNELYYHQRIGPDARRRRGVWSSRQAARKAKELLSASLHQAALFAEAIDNGDVRKIVEYVPLDMSIPADRAYHRVQLKRHRRGMSLS